MLNVRKLTPELAIKARDELNEVESRIPEDIATLRTWIEKQPHLRARTSDQFLLTFLRGCKYSIEKAKQKIDFYYTIRTHSAEIFLHKPVDESALTLSRLGPFLTFRIPVQPDGPRLKLCRYFVAQDTEFSVRDMIKYDLQMLDMALHEDDNLNIAGVVTVIDLSSLPLRLVLQFDPVLFKKLGVFAEKALPYRVKGLHLINVPKEAVTLINMAQKALGRKLEKRLIVHSSMESVYQHIPQEYFPEEYGGTNGRLQDAIDYHEQRLLKYKEFFEEDTQYRVDEKLRVGQKMNSESLFGLEGSFRKLQVD